MKVAVVGCCHGSLDEIYGLISELEKERNFKIDLLLVCGDFQSLRNPADLECLAVPHKYRAMGSFHKYYSGKVRAPVLTLFIGGNHEASNYLQELPFGGWVAPNIYYMGLASVVKFGGLRIAGMSGIYKSQDYGRGHHECMPYNESAKRSIYHVRSLEHFKFKLLEQDKIDIMMGHDWPRGIWQYGNVQELLRWKPYFKEDIDNGSLGNPPTEELLHLLRPKYYFAGHLHCRFAAQVVHKNETTTNFLALDKVLPRRKFLEIVDISAPCDNKSGEGAEPILELDQEWLCILRNTASLWNSSYGFIQLPVDTPSVEKLKVTKAQLDELNEDFGGEFQMPENFEPTAPVYQEGFETSDRRNFQMASQHYQLCHYLNPQTALICQMLEIENPAIQQGQRASRNGLISVNKIEPLEGAATSVDETKAIAQEEVQKEVPASSAVNQNPDEINLDFSDDDDNGGGDESHGEPEAKRATLGAD